MTASFQSLYFYNKIFLKNGVYIKERNISTKVNDALIGEICMKR